MSILDWRKVGDAPLPPDRSVEEAAQEAAAEQEIEREIELRMHSPAWVSDAQGDFSQLMYDMITEAIMVGDALRVGELTIAATRASIERSVRRHAGV